MATPQERAQRTIDAVYRQWGFLATYTPPSGPAIEGITILRGAPDVQLAGVNGGPFMQADEVEVRISEVAAPVKGGTYTLAEGGEVLTILSDPQSRDDFGLVLRMTVS